MNLNAYSNLKVNKMNFYDQFYDLDLSEDAQINWYLKWKDRIINSLKTNTDNFLKYTNQQIKENGSFLEQNREVILNNRKYPVNFKNPIKNAPNYQEAIRRLSRPVSNSLAGLNLNKIEIQDNQVSTNDTTNNKNTVVESNVWFRKLVIPIYDGKNSFTETAKAYFYGSEKRYNLNIQEIQRILSIGFKFCYNYNRTSKSINTDLMNLISFINRNPVSGLQQNPTTVSDLQAIKNNQYNNSLKASTNPNRNVIHADTDYSYFMSNYFGDILNEDQIKDTKDTNKEKVDADQLNNKPKVDNTNTNQISSKRKQIACDILQDAYNAKITAMGLIYRDFINIMKNHVSNYK